MGAAFLTILKIAISEGILQGDDESFKKVNVKKKEGVKDRAWIGPLYPLFVVKLEKLNFISR